MGFEFHFQPDRGFLSCVFTIDCVGLNSLGGIVSCYIIMTSARGRWGFLFTFALDRGIMFGQLNTVDHGS